MYTEPKSKDTWLIIKAIVLLLIFIGLIGSVFFRYIFGSYTFSRTYGGESTVMVEPNRKVMNVTWKGDSLWILTREMNASDTAESYTYREYSNLGILEGEIIVKEVKK